MKAKIIFYGMLIASILIGKKIDNEGLIFASENLICKSVKLTNEDVQEIKLINNGIMKTYVSLPVAKVPQYSVDLQRTVINSNVSPQLKANILSTAVFVSNSALCAK